MATVSREIINDRWAQATLDHEAGAPGVHERRDTLQDVLEEFAGILVGNEYFPKELGSAIDNLIERISDDLCDWAEGVYAARTKRGKTVAA